MTEPKRFELTGLSGEYVFVMGWGDGAVSTFLAPEEVIQLKEVIENATRQGCSTHRATHYVGCNRVYWCYCPVCVRVVMGCNMVTTLIALAVVVICIAVIRLIDKD